MDYRYFLLQMKYVHLRETHAFFSFLFKQNLQVPHFGAVHPANLPHLLFFPDNKYKLGSKHK